MSGDHDDHRMKPEVIWISGGINPYTGERMQNYDYVGPQIQKPKWVGLTQEEMKELREALEEAVYLLNPTDEDMQKKAGVYRVVTALEKLREKNT